MASKNAPAVPRRQYADFWNEICHTRTSQVRQSCVVEGSARKVENIRDQDEANKLRIQAEWPEAIDRGVAAASRQLYSFCAAVRAVMTAYPCGTSHGDVRFRILHSNQLFPRTRLPVDVGESRFEDITDWLPRAAVELNQSQVFDRPKVRRSSVDFDPR